MAAITKVFAGVFIGALAAFLTLDTFQTQREHMAEIWSKLCTSCPHHVMLDILKASGIWQGETASKKDTKGPINLIKPDTGFRVFTKEELTQYDGDEGSKGLYLGILGRVYDVSRGRDYYAPGGGYSFFAAKDGTRAFVTGEFNEAGLVDNVEGFKPEQMMEVEKWIKFYEESYTFKGLLSGNFYDSNGKATEALEEAQNVLEQGYVKAAAQEAEKKIFPPCNSKWSQADGSTFWCTKESGGVKREWVGVPRKFFRQGMHKPKCVCVRTTGPPSGDPDSESQNGDLDNPMLQEYDGCAPTSVQCKVQKPKTS